MTDAITVREIGEWQPIETAPKDGTHILACWATYNEHWTFNQSPPCVVHYFPDPHEPGFYNSLGNTDKPLPVKLWKPLGPEPRL